LTYLLPYWWTVVVGAVAVGYTVNWIGIQMIYWPLRPKWWVPWGRGLMLRRRGEIIDAYADLIADEIITTENLARELLVGSRSDRTVQMLETVMRDAVDNAVGRARSLVRFSLGSDEYDRLQAELAPEALHLATGVLADRRFVTRQAGRIRTFCQTQMRELSLEEFVDLLRSATRQDEWLLFVHGAVLGSVGGLIHLAIFGV
jgi:uncharacterized membrane protein YheB (UPF0754 family)